MKITKRIARKIAYPLAMMARVDKLIQNSSDNSILNITYHGVVNHQNPRFSGRHVSKEQFEKQLKYYKNNFDIVSTKKAFELIRDRIKPKRKTITISFDDGYLNNFETALPLLEKYQVPATFYISSICTEELETRWLWPDVLAALNYFHKESTIKKDRYTFVNLFDKTNNLSLSDYLKSCTYKKRDLFLHELIKQYDLSDKIKTLPKEIWSILTKDDLIQLAKSKYAEIGSHGHLHYNLGEIDIIDAKTELKHSKELLEKAIGQEVISIAYPDGSYNNEVKNAAEELGYLNQIAVNYRESSDYEDTRIINRHSVSTSITLELNMLFLSYAFKQKGI